MQAKYITRVSRGIYALTPSGQKFAGNFSTATYHQVDNIKTVLMLTSHKSTGEYLCFKWNRQPYLGFVTLLHDRMIVGKGLGQAVQDALTNKCGLAPSTPVSYVGGGFVVIRHQDIVVSHMYAVVYSVDPKYLQLPFYGKNGTAFWAKLLELAPNEKMTNFDNMVSLLNESGGLPFEAELAY